MQRHWRLDSTLGIAALLLTAGCGGGEEGPSESPPAIAKAPTMNGDAQTGPAGQI